VRDPAKAKERLGPDVELAVGDFEDRPSLRRALQGVDRVFLTSADNPRKVEHETAVIDAAAAAWVQRIVKLSSPRVEIGSDLAFWDWHGRIEQHLQDSGVPAVVLRGNFFMSGLLASAEAVRQTGTLFAPAGDAKIAMVDPRDVGAAAAVLLSEDGPDGTAYTVTGPQAATFHDVADALSAATGREIRFVHVPDDAAREALLRSGAPDWLATTLVRLFGKLRAGVAVDVTDTVRSLTGRPPRSIAEWAREHAAGFRA
jgi:uncharacterized protein YbjT (DUF2867 family)